MEHKKVINISFNELSAWQDYLDNKGNETGGVVTKYTADFGETEDGHIEVDIKVVDAEQPFVDPVIFQDGHDVGCLEVDDTLAGEYIFSGFLKNTYVVIIPDTIAEARPLQDKYQAVAKWLENLDDETLDTVDKTTLAEVQSGAKMVDRIAAIEDVLQRCDHYEEILDSLYERATIKFSANGKQAFTSDASVEKN